MCTAYVKKMETERGTERYNMEQERDDAQVGDYWRNELEKDENDIMLKNKIQKNMKECNLWKDTNTNRFIQFGLINL